MIFNYNTMVYERNFDTGAATVDSMAFNRDGTKLYTFDVTSRCG